MTGHLHLRVVYDPITGRSAIREQSARAPMHLGKGHWDADGGLLTVFAVNATAGLFAGDEVEWRIEVGPKARLRLVSPSATRVFRAARQPGAESLPARATQHFQVAAGGWLEVWPEWFIPHAGSRGRQATRLEIARGGAALFCEAIAPGRVAMGEAWAGESLRWSTDIAYAGRPVARERWEMAPRTRPDTVTGWREAGRALGTDAPFYGTIFLVGDQVNAAHPGWQRLHELQPESASDPGPDERWVGLSRLAADAGWVVKVLARDGAVLRRTLGEVRGEMLGMMRDFVATPVAAM